ncbi:GGDEF domain-containing protein [Parasalinivibrio latis]|uniref:EAL domain-containing protein n=1 Tax=Parasalinivibrio latis TaxID=2952610 RepID=UPI0030E0AADD
MTDSHSEKMLFRHFHVTSILVTALFLVVGWFATLNLSHKAAEHWLSNTQKHISYTAISVLNGIPPGTGYQTLEALFHPLLSAGELHRLAITFPDDRDIYLTSTTLQGELLAPAWFSALVMPSSTYNEKFLVSNGKMGELTFSLNTSKVADSLWEEALFHLILITAAGLFLLFPLLNSQRKNLRSLEKLRMALNHLAETKTPLPAPVSISDTEDELQEMAEAINASSDHLRSLHLQHAQEADKLRKRAYQDPVSGLANRSFLIPTLECWLKSPGRGGIALFQFDLVKDLYSERDYEKADKLVAKLAEQMKAHIREETIIARLSHSEFMLVDTLGNREDLETQGRLLLFTANEIEHGANEQSGNAKGALAIVMRDNSMQDVSTMLAQADNALARARGMPDRVLVLESALIQNALGKKEWQQLVEEAISNRRFHFALQPSLSRNANPLYFEIYTMIRRGDETYPAREFMSAIAGTPMAVEVDKLVVSTFIFRLNQESYPGPITINLTHTSVSDQGFKRWLQQKLRTYPLLRDRILFELPEISFIKEPENTQSLCQMIHDFGFGYGIDNFEHHFSSAEELETFRPDYIKLDSAFTLNLNDNQRTDALVSITRTAGNLNIITIATGIESTEQRSQLADLGIDAFQGFAVQEVRSSKRP